MARCARRSLHAEGLFNPRRLLKDLTRSDTGRAAGMGAAVIAQNVLALVFTVIFARVLGASGYGSLAVLVSAYIILMVPGSALQIAVARELSGERAAGVANVGPGFAAGWSAWPSPRCWLRWRPYRCAR